MEATEARCPAHSPLILTQLIQSPGFPERTSRLVLEQMAQQEAQAGQNHALSAWWEHSALTWEDTWQASFLPRRKLRLGGLEGKAAKPKNEVTRITSQQLLPLLVRASVRTKHMCWSQVAYFSWV